MTNKKLSIIFLVLVVGAVALGVWLQFSLIVNPDNYLLLQITNSFLHGGRYYTDFIDVSPPMILYLYAPAAVIANTFHFSIYPVFRFYIAGIAMIVLLISNELLKRSDEKNGKWFRYFLMLSLLYVFFFFLPSQFGQRDPLALMLIMPYLFLTDLRASQKQVNPYLCVVIGVLSGLGFAIKPYFLIPLLFVEILLMVKRKNILTLFRPEMLTIGSVMAVYLLLVFIVTPEYITKIIPLLSGLYYVSDLKSWIALIAYSPFLFWLVTIIIYVLYRHKLRHKNLADILFVAAVGFIFVYFIQQLLLIYHLFPADALMVVLVFLLTSELLFAIADHKSTSPKKTWIDGLFIIVMIVIMIFFPIVKTTVLSRESSLKNNHLAIMGVKRVLRQYGHDKTVFVISSRGYDVMLLTAYGHRESLARFPVTLLFRTMYVAQRKMFTSKDKKETDKIKRKQQKIVSLFAENVAKINPSLIFIRTRVGSSRTVNLEDLSAIQLLSDNKAFKALWGNYKYIGHTPSLLPSVFEAGGKMYELAVYKRMK